MTKDQAVIVASQFFKNHTVNELFVTEDEQVFFQEQNAVNHATSLPRENQTVINVERGECEDKPKAKAADKTADKLKAKISALELKATTLNDDLVKATSDAGKAKIAAAIEKCTADLSAVKEELAALEPAQ